MRMTEAAWPRVSARVATIALLAALVAACGPQNNRNDKLAHEGRHGHGLRLACADDIEKYCANADRRRRCLKQNIDKLSEPCKTALAQRRNRGANNEGANGSNANNNNANNNKTNNPSNNSDDDDNN